MIDLVWASPELQAFLANAAANTVGSLAAVWVQNLLSAAGSRVRQRFLGAPEQEALERAASAAITSTAATWRIANSDYADLWERYGAWLLNPAVLGEFRALLSPTPNTTLDLDLLREEFEAGGLDVTGLGLPDFDALIQDMVGAFYLAASSEPLLQEPLKIGLLRQLAESLGALERIAARQLSISAQSLDTLQSLRAQARQAAADRAMQLILLQSIYDILKERSQDWLTRHVVYTEVSAALHDAELDLSASNGGRSAPESPNLGAELAQVQGLLADIRDGLLKEQQRTTADELAALELRYRQSIVEWFEVLSFQGMSPTGTAIALPLREVYVELRAIAQVPEAADTYSAEERRLLLEAEEGGRYDRAELIAHLDALRLERWRKEARSDARSRQERRSIAELLRDGAQRGLVILGDPGAGKSTLLHYLALTAAAEAPGAPLPIYVPFAAYDDYLRRTNAEISLGDFLAVYYDKRRSQPGLGPLFSAALAEGRALVLLDGLDEVLDTPMRQNVAAQAAALIGQWQGRGSRFVVTSRMVGYREAMLPPALPHVTVLDFGPPEIELFARQWHRAYEVWVAGRASAEALRQAEAQEKALLEDVRANPSVERLAANPLLLTMLALLRRQVGKLPDRRIQLYDKYLETMVVHWEQGRSLGARTQKPARFDPHRALAYLIDLAYWLQRTRPSGTATRRDVEGELAAICLRFRQVEPKPPRHSSGWRRSRKRPISCTTCDTLPACWPSAGATPLAFCT